MDTSVSLHNVLFGIYSVHVEEMMHFNMTDCDELPLYEYDSFSLASVADFKKPFG